MICWPASTVWVIYYFYMKLNKGAMRCCLFVLIVAIISCHRTEESKDQTIAEVNYKYVGCFASDSASLFIKQIRDSVYAVLHSEGHKKIASLNLEGQRAFFDFIEKIKNIRGLSFCTTVQYYDIKTKDGHFVVRDGNCDKYYFDSLIHAMNFSSLIREF
jgi:hypothetical protein